jgi:ABC transporter substrate binding protein (PQQ-dependent alcohol dehydrogenase system)
MLLGVAPAFADTTDAVTIGFITRETLPPHPVSPMDEPAANEGTEGARLGLADNSTTGRFLKLNFALAEVTLGLGDDAAGALDTVVGKGARFVVVDLPAADLRLLSAAARQRGLLLFNTRATDDRLRNDWCDPAYLLHVMPSRAMLADGLAQYLMARQWRRWMLIVGPAEEDKAFADATRAAAKKFGAKISEEKSWRFATGPGRADTGHVSLQSEIPAFTRGADHDVVLVADEGGLFGDYLPWRTASPRPVVGTHGLVATAWDRVHEQWGAGQLQTRFQRQASRAMTARDYAAWLTVRAIGEAAVRTRSVDTAKIETYLRGPDFALAGFKGQPLSFRTWDGQLRQPILLVGPRMLVSVSPQPGFLHQGSELDTLGQDEGDSRCQAP